MANGNFTNIYAAGFISAAGNITGSTISSKSAISAVGSITASRFYGNGVGLTGITNVDSADRARVVIASSQPAITSVGILTSLSVNGTVRARSFSGDGSQLANIVANSSVRAGTVTANAQPNITTVGTLNSLSVVGTVSAYNLVANGSVRSLGNIVSTNGYIVGNGAFLTGVVSTASNAISAISVSSNAQPNITSLGTLTSLNVNGNTIVRNLSTSGTVTAQRFVGDGSQLTGVGGVAPSRVSLRGTISLLNAGASANLDITGYKGYALYSIQTSSAVWATVYISSATRAADASRPQGVDPAPGSGVVGEVITGSNATLYFTPAIIGYNADIPVSTNIPLKVVNNSGSATAITITLTLVKVES